MRTFPILRHLRSVPPSLLKASPKGEGVHPSQSGTLSHADLQGAKWILANLTGVNLAGANLQAAHLEGAKWMGADLQAANLQAAELEGAKWMGVNLTGANLTGSDMRNCEGLIKEQLAEAVADPDNQPDLRGTVDAKAGEQLEWSGGVDS